MGHIGTLEIVFAHFTQAGIGEPVRHFSLEHFGTYLIFGTVI